MTPAKDAKELLQDLELTAFQPFPFINNGFLQTVLGAVWPQERDPGSAQIHKVSLGEGDFTTVAVDKPDGWSAGNRICLLVHGLTGSLHSTYMVRMAKLLPARGVLTVRMNLRNCGSAFGLSRKTYHAGITDDARALLKWIAQEYPGSPVTAVGFSLGGNILLKLATEDAASPTAGLDSVAAISPATDLVRSSAKLSVSPGSWIERLFMRELLRDVEKLAKQFPGLPTVARKGRARIRIRDFDELHVARMHGFKGADDYYERSSSLTHLSQIAIPTLIVGAMDDPVVEFIGLRDREVPACVDVLLTESGGHVGFVARNGKRWADDAILAWMKRRLS